MKITIIVSIVGMFFIICLFRYLYNKNNSDIENLFYKTKKELLHYFDLKELCELRINFETSVSKHFGDDYIKFIIPFKYRKEAKEILNQIDDKIDAIILNKNKYEDI